MNFIRTAIPNVAIIKPTVHGDERGIAFNNKALNIEWQIPYSELNLSAKDRVQPKLRETSDLFEYGVNYYA